MRPRGGGQGGRVVGQPGRGAGHLGAEDLPDLGPVPVDGRYQDVAGPVVAELDDELGQVGLQRVDAVGGQTPASRPA